MTQSTSDPVLACIDLACGFPTRSVLCSVSFEVFKGSVTGIVGTNGSGKSTLLNTLSGVLAPLSGEVRAGGENIARMSAKSRATFLGFVPQQESTEFSFTALEIAGMGRIARSTGLFETSEDLEKARGALERVDAGHLVDRRFRELSGGEQQRVMIARALAQEPEVLLLDEPSSHLDLAHQASMIRLLRELASGGTTIMVAVHDLNWANAAVDSVIALGDGKVLYQGKMEPFLDGPSCEATFGTRLTRVKGPTGRTIALPDYS